jgi:murein DD-endopeptidase MepM/ murein hydrolase activator NlpD
LVAVAAVFFAFDTVARGRAAVLAKENRLLKAELEVIEGRVAELDHTMATLAERDSRIRGVAGLMGIDEEVFEVGIGGPGLETPGESELWNLNPEVSEETYAIRYDLAYLMRQAELLERSFTESEESLHDRRERLEATPSIAPVNGRVSSRFTHSREHPIDGEIRPHYAIDFAAPRGTPIIATAPGRVVFSGARGGYGNLIEIDHGFGLRTRYGHASKLHKRTGQRVERAEVIAEVGCTGLCEGSHVHYEVLLDGRRVNPSNYILRAGRS